MKLVNAIAALVFLFYVNSYAQQLDYQTALALFNKNSEELKILRESYYHQISELKDYSLIENPSLKYEREEIKAPAGNEFEEVLILEQKLDLLFQPVLKSSIVSREEEALNLMLQYEEVTKISEFKSNYNNLLLSRNIYELYLNTYEITDKAYKSVQAGYDEGRSSGFELKRFAVNNYKMKSELEKLKNEYLDKLGDFLNKIYTKEELRDLLQTGLDSLIVKDDFITVFVTPDLQEFQEKALNFRKDLQALKIFSETGESRLTVEKLNRMPGVSIEGGYKNVRGLGDGYTLGISLDLPLFNFNGNNVNKAEAKNKIMNDEVRLKEKKILLETSHLFNRISSFKKLFKEYSSEIDASSIIETAVMLYSEGEINLVELLDAVNSYIEGSTLYLNTLCEYNNTLAEAEKILGINLIGN